MKIASAEIGGFPSLQAVFFDGACDRFVRLSCESRLAPLLHGDFVQRFA